MDATLEKALENPIIRIVAGTGLVLATTGVIRSLLFNLFDLLGIFERSLFERWWNSDRVTWFALVLTVLLWVAVGLALKFDQVLIGAVAGVFLVWTVIVRNVAIDLPDFLGRLLFILESLVALVGLALGLLTLARVRAPMGSLGASVGGLGAPTPGEASFSAPFAAEAPSFVEPPAPAVPVEAADFDSGLPAQPMTQSMAHLQAQAAAADPTSAEAPDTQPAGWYADPKGEATWRWWDGQAWTANTN